jgi:hypothetical protein
MRFFLLAAVLVCAPVAAQTYKWVDSNGRTQYSDRPPANAAKSESIKSRVSSVTGGVPAATPVPKDGEAPQSNAKANGEPSAPMDKEQAFRKRQQDAIEQAAKQAKLEQEDRTRKQICDQARGRLAGLEAGGRQVRFDAKGERTFLGDAEIEQEKRQARQQISELCK